MGRFGRLLPGPHRKGDTVAVRVIRREFAADRWFRACLREQVDVVSRIRSPRVAAAVLHRVLRVGPDLRGLDPGLVPVVAACLHPDPARRPAPREVRAALAAACHEPACFPTADDIPAPAHGSRPHFRRRHRHGSRSADHGPS